MSDGAYQGEETGRRTTRIEQFAKKVSEYLDWYKHQHEPDRIPVDPTETVDLWLLLIGMGRTDENRGAFMKRLRALAQEHRKEWEWLLGRTLFDLMGTKLFEEVARHAPFSPGSIFQKVHVCAGENDSRTFRLEGASLEQRLAERVEEAHPDTRIGEDFLVVIPPEALALMQLVPVTR